VMRMNKVVLTDLRINFEDTPASFLSSSNYFAIDLDLTQPPGAITIVTSILTDEKKLSD